MPNSVADMPEPESSAPDDALPGKASKQLRHKVSDDGLPSSASSFTMKSTSRALNASGQPPLADTDTRDIQKKENESRAEKGLQEHAVIEERSRVASIMLVLVCFTGMVVNVSRVLLPLSRV